MPHASRSTQQAHTHQAKLDAFRDLTKLLKNNACTQQTKR